MSRLPGLDVVIPVLNGLPFLRAAVDSALEQTGMDVSVFVVDDGSTDGTVAAVRSWNLPQVTLIDGLGHSGIGRVRNVGARLGQAPWLGFLDADDLWPRMRSARLVSAIADPAAEIAVGRMLPFRDGTGVDLEVDHPTAGTPPAHLAGGTLFSRELFTKVGGMDESLRVGEFVDWIARARSLGLREVDVDTVSLLRRIHPHNTSRTRQDEYRRDYLQLIKEHRRRSRGLAEA